MGMFDNIEANLNIIADQVGLPPHHVREIANTFQANLTSSDGNPLAAIEVTAAQQGVSIATIEEIINLGGGLESELGDISGKLFRAGA